MTQFIVSITEIYEARISIEAKSKEEACFLVGQMDGRDELKEEMIHAISIEATKDNDDQP